MVNFYFPIHIPNTWSQCFVDRDSKKNQYTALDILQTEGLIKETLRPIESAIF